ncbi:MAG: spondin domain-containing protein [Gammaproteobacteria bacterium]|nr:spondin domain-containing protein [Gammaproteobacteria bacterium]
MLPAVAAICVGAPATGQDTATYSVTFGGNWTTESTTVPVPGSAHFTDLIGAIHNGNVTFWRSGGTASPGIELMAETGLTSILRSEIQASPHAHAVIEQEVSFGGRGTARFDIEVPDDHPLITLTSMIGPSPDWFVGISGVSLLDGDGDWRRAVMLDLYPYDAGTEDGTTFSLSNPDTNPRETITSIRGTAPFSDAEPMARLSFVLDTTGRPPGRVTGVVVTPGIGLLAVSWDPVDDADGYKLQWGSGDQAFGPARQHVVGASTTEDTIPNLTPGVQYFVRVIATKTGTGDGAPSNVNSGTPLSVPNRRPETTGQIATQFLQVGGSVQIDLSNHFRDPDGRPMRFSAVSDHTPTATVEVDGSVLTIRGIASGEASVTVTALDGGGLTATQSFEVIAGRATDSLTMIELLAAGDTVTVDLTSMFAGAEGETLTYVVESSDPELLTVSVEGTNLVLAPNEVGDGGVVTLTVAATDADNLTATLSFLVTIEPNPQGFLRGWRKALFER